jgi:hypothetical protein
MLSAQGKLLERQRLEQRTMYDLESIEQMGFCSGIENYSRHLTGRAPGEPPPTLMDYFDSDYLLIIDESHQTVPQIGAMYNGDRSRKETLVEFGFGRQQVHRALQDVNPAGSATRAPAVERNRCAMLVLKVKLLTYGCPGCWALKTTPRNAGAGRRHLTRAPITLENAGSLRPQR